MSDRHQLEQLEVTVATERALLGVALLEPEALPDVLSLPTTAFDKEAHREIHAVIRALASQGLPADSLTVAGELADRGRLDEVGGRAYLSLLLEEATVASSVPEYAARIRDSALKRGLERLGRQIAADARNGRPADQLVENLETELRALTSDLPAKASVPAGRLKVMSWMELTQGPPEAIEYFWPGWIGLATVAIMAGAGESLKSWLAAYLACMAAAGRPAFAEPGSDEPPIRQGAVLYLAGENALAEERRRCQLLKAGLELPDDLPITFVEAGALNLSDPADYAAVVALVEQLRPVLIVIDSAIALAGLARENDNSEVRAFMKRRVLPLARQHESTVLLIGHSPKTPIQPGVAFGDEHVARGAGDWRNAADTVLYLKRDRSLGECAVVLKHAKQRIGPRHAPLWFELQELDPGHAVRLVYGGRFSEDAQGIQAGVQKAIAALVGVLKASPAGVYRRDLGTEVLAGGISKATYRRALEVLRGKKPWPHGPLRGKTQAVVTEDRHGKQVFLALDVAAWPADEDWDDA